MYDFQTDHATMVTGKAELNAREVIIEASQKIGLKVGGNFITIDASGITMNGTMMKLNSGGWGAETGDAVHRGSVRRLHLRYGRTGLPGPCPQWRRRPEGPEQQKAEIATCAVSRPAGRRSAHDRDARCLAGFGGGTARPRRHAARRSPDQVRQLGRLLLRLEHEHDDHESDYGYRLPDHRRRPRNEPRAVPSGGDQP